ncbi:hypothetical protein N658DRAFT_511741 [Parathielavia hyrcaniae]|uniref:Uncharacterized protein n=1 Tax=Parathielavia hyrcaniae TaxID=113614 RepID=A0AAN6PSD1_9PEZI|nr:hypothetical protein N658DRAFT_511741 [Parathielavia hyrcaniae]
MYNSDHGLQVVETVFSGARRKRLKMAWQASLLVETALSLLEGTPVSFHSTEGVLGGVKEFLVRLFLLWNVKATDILAAFWNTTGGGTIGLALVPIDLLPWNVHKPVFEEMATLPAGEPPPALLSGSLRLAGWVSVGLAPGLVYSMSFA